MLDGVTGALNEKQTSYIAGIKESSERLARLINDLLDLSVIESGKIKLVRTPLFAAGSCLRSHRSITAGRHGKECELDGGTSGARPFLPGLIATKLRKCLQIWLATRSNSLLPEAASSWRRRTKRFKLALRLCQRHGPGDRAEEAARIFDEFYQIHNPGKENPRAWALAWRFQENRRAASRHNQCYK